MARRRRDGRAADAVGGLRPPPLHHRCAAVPLPQTSWGRNGKPIPPLLQQGRWQCAALTEGRAKREGRHVVGMIRHAISPRLAMSKEVMSTLGSIMIDDKHHEVFGASQAIERFPPF